MPTLYPSVCDNEMKTLIKESHERSRSYGLSPDDVPVLKTVLVGQELRHRVDQYRDFISIANLFGTRVLELLSETGVVVLVCDDNNVVLEHFGCEVMRKKLFEINMIPGAQFDERVGGTNSIVLSRISGKPTAVVGEDHYHKPLHGLACYTVPFNFRFSSLSGTLTVMTSAEGHSNYRMALLVSLVESVKREFILRHNYKRQRVLTSIVTGTSTSGVIIIDNRGYVTEFNPTAERLFGVKSSEILSQNYVDLGEFSDIIAESILKGENMENIDFVLTNCLGETYRCLVDVIHFFGDKEDLVDYQGTFVQVRDVTERYNMEQQMIITDRFAAIGKLAAGLAHEIRNPLTSVMGFMQLVKVSKDITTLEKYFDIIYSELQRVKDLVSDFVVVSKPSAPLKKKVNLRDFVEEVSAFMDSQALLKGVEIKYDFDFPENFEIGVDPPQIKQVLINTIQNAIEATETSKDSEKAKIDVVCKRDKKKRVVRISVIDKGCGMSKEDLEHVFTPFFTTKDTGTGLGMAVSYRIVENHDGNMTISSKKGSGTRVDITLPYD